MQLFGNNMKKITIILIFITYSAFTEPAPGFDGIVDFKITLKELDSIAKSSNFQKLKDKYIILDGSLTEYTVKENSDTKYLVEIELIDGEWAGVSNVFMYKCLILLKGEEYKKLFPERRRTTPAPGEIPINSNLIIVAKIKEIRLVENNPVPVLDGYYIRVRK
jgi:hypothetical protein